jgi:ABC-2 type transport system permease protein
MSEIIAVYKREMGLYFRSPIAYAVAFAMLILFGLLFGAVIVNASNYNLQGQGRPFTADNALADYLSVFSFLMFLVAPLLTMRLIAEEAREGTLEVLMTLPMHESSFIIGKFLAAWTYYTILLLLTLVYYLLLTLVGVPDAGLAFSAYLGVWLYGGAVLAITLIWSAVTEDQIVAAFLGAATILVLYLSDAAAVWVSGQNFTAGAADFVREIGLRTHFAFTMLSGVIRAEDIAYFVVIIIGALFITTRIVEIRRWRA